MTQTLACPEWCTTDHGAFADYPEDDWCSGQTFTVHLTLSQPSDNTRLGLTQMAVADEADPWIHLATDRGAGIRLTAAEARALSSALSSFTDAAS